MTIRFTRISKAFGDKRVLQDVSFEVADGEVFFIIGASGVGKSVLIKHLIGLLSPDEGEIWLDGQEISRFDEAAMYGVCAEVRDGLPALDALRLHDLRGERRPPTPQARQALAERRAGRSPAPASGRSYAYEFADRYPAELGDGMRMRVAIARALTLDPKYVLFDEPTTSLDPVSARRVDKLIRELSDKLGVTSIVVSHDLNSIFSIADRIVMLYKGNVRLMGTRDDFKRSTDGIVDQFIHGRAQGPIGSLTRVDSRLRRARPGRASFDSRKSWRRSDRSKSKSAS